MAHLETIRNRVFYQLLYVLPYWKWVRRLMIRFRVEPPAFRMKARIRKIYRKRIGVAPNFDSSPGLGRARRFNEKMQLYKLKYRNALLPTLMDKHAARAYLQEQGLGELLNTQYGVFSSPGEIDWDALPNQFVIRNTHDSGGVFIVRDKAKTDLGRLEQGLRRRLRRPFGINKGEWLTAYITPRISVERYMEDESGGLRDYRVHCFSGLPYCIVVDSPAHPENSRMYKTYKFEKEYVRSIYDMDWNKLPFQWGYPEAPFEIPRPALLPEMTDASMRLAKPFPYVRLDFHTDNDRLYFGEFTFYAGSGFSPITPEAWDFKLGERFDFP